MQGNVLGQSGSGIKINGLIEEYRVASGGNINAGDFVKFMYKRDTALTTINNITGANITPTVPIEIKDNVYVVSGTSSVLVISLTDKNTSISTTISSNFVNNSFDAIKISENKIFVVYSGYSTTLYAALCKIEENGNVTVLWNQSIENNSGNGRIISITKLSENKVFIGHCNNMSEYCLSALVCTLDDNGIEIGVDTQLSQENCSSAIISVTKLAENKVFIAHNNNKDNNYLKGMICTINGTEITVNADIGLTTQLCFNSNVPSNSKIGRAHV